MPSLAALGGNVLAGAPGCGLATEPAVGAAILQQLDPRAHLNRKLRFCSAREILLPHQPVFDVSNGFSGRFTAQKSP